jgi:protein-disulfide isomerase
MRLIILLGIAGTFLFGQEWQTATALSGVDFSGLTAPQKTAVLKIIREQDCGCGCSMKVAECRVKDAACGVSRGLAVAAVKGIKAGKSPAEVSKEVAELASKGPGSAPLLEDPISISIAGDPVRGAPKARITIVEFSDFQCPYCSAAAIQMNALLEKYPNDVKLVFKQFPLDIHSQARLAAQASLAAAEQNKFWELHDKMFANYRRLSRENIMGWAKDIGLDLTRFTKDIDKPAYKTRIDREVEEGVNAGVSGTPSFFINGKKYNGPIDPDRLKPILDAELK